MNKAACEAPASKKRDGLFAQRGAGWIVGGSIGQSALFCQGTGWLNKLAFVTPFLGKQKSNEAVGREMVVFINSIVHVNNKTADVEAACSPDLPQMHSFIATGGF